MKALVSVIIPTYNREKVITRAIKSVINQTYKRLEIIVVDDCSTDDTERIIKHEFENESRLKFFKLEENSGACAARNMGIQLSSGEYITFLDSDDEYLPEKIELQINQIIDTNTDICISGFYYIDKNNKKNIRSIPDVSNMYEELLYRNFVTTGAILGKKSCFVNNYFDVHMPRYQDWELIIRLFTQYSVSFVNKPLLIQYYQSQSITSSTGHKKTFDALSKIYCKYYDDFNEYRKSYAGINWQIGIQTIFLDQKTDWKKLWIGVLSNGLDVKRLAVIICAYGGFKGLIEKKK